MDIGNTSDLLTCPVCLEWFKEPRNLPCQHPFCKSCLEAIVNTARKASGTESEPLINCPKCRGAHSVPLNGVGGFPSNLTLVALLEVSAVPTAPSHKDLQTETSLLKRQGTILARCQECKKENCEAGCRHCEKILCRSCLLKHCEEISGELKATIRQQVNVLLPKFQKQISERREPLDKVYTNGEDLKSEINQWRRTCNDHVEARANEMLSKVDEFVQAQTSSWLPHVEDATKELAGMRSFCQKAEKDANYIPSDSSITDVREHQKTLLGLIEESNKQTEIIEGNIQREEDNVKKILQAPEKLAKFPQAEARSVVSSILKLRGITIESSKRKRPKRMGEDSGRK